MTDQNTTPPPGGQTPPAGDPPGQTPPQTPPGQTPPPAQRTSLDALPPDIQDYIKTLREESKTLRKQVADEAQKKQQEEEARLKEQGQFKQLAEQHEARVKELEPVAARFEKLSEIVNEQIKGEIKEWPAELKTFDPGPSAPVESRMEWVQKSRPLVAKLTQQPASPGNSPSPRPAGQNSQQDVEELRKRYRETGRYAF